MGWLTDTEATGKRMEHIDGSRGTVLSVDGEMAEIKWDDGSTSLQHEDDLLFIEDDTLLFLTDY